MPRLQVASGFRGGILTLCQGTNGGTVVTLYLLVRWENLSYSFTLRVRVPTVFWPSKWVVVFWALEESVGVLYWRVRGSALEGS